MIGPLPAPLLAEGPNQTVPASILHPPNTELAFPFRVIPASFNLVVPPINFTVPPPVFVTKLLGLLFPVNVPMVMVVSLPTSRVTGPLIVVVSPEY